MWVLDRYTQSSTEHYSLRCLSIWLSWDSTEPVRCDTNQNVIMQKNKWGPASLCHENPFLVPRGISWLPTIIAILSILGEQEWDSQNWRFGFWWGSAKYMACTCTIMSSEKWENSVYMDGVKHCISNYARECGSFQDISTDNCVRIGQNLVYK